MRSSAPDFTSEQQQHMDRHVNEKDDEFDQLLIAEDEQRWEECGTNLKPQEMATPGPPHMAKRLLQAHQHPWPTSGNQMS